jgi:hypothetical protein
MTGSTSLRTSDIPTGLAAIVHAAREVDLPDPLELARRTDLARRIDLGRGLADDAAATLARTIARSLGRGRRRSHRRQAVIGLAIGLIALAVFAGWRAWRKGSDIPGRTALDPAYETPAMGIDADTSWMDRVEQIPVAMEMAVTDETAVAAEIRIDGQNSRADGAASSGIGRSRV